MKKRIVIILIVIGLLAVLFTPIPTGICNDGGTRVYSALTYKIVDWNRLTGESTYSKTRAYFFPENFKSIDTLWKIEFIETLSSFKAIVLEINENSVLVRPSAGSDISGVDKVEFSTANLPELDIKVGSKIKVTYNGQVMYSYPAQINALEWEIVE